MSSVVLRKRCIAMGCRLERSVSVNQGYVLIRVRLVLIPECDEVEGIVAVVQSCLNVDR